LMISNNHQKNSESSKKVFQSFLCRLYTLWQKTFRTREIN